jgi:streptogramin lyase
MRLARLLAPITLGLSLLILLAIVNQATFQHLEAAAVDGREAALNHSGQVWEINLDDAGNLWISDFKADEIWQVHPASGAYTIYQELQAPADARLDASGNLWWGDGVEGRFGRLDLATGTAHWWLTPGADSLFGTQIDDQGNFWVAGWAVPALFKFQPEAGQLCTYTLPLEGSADYPIYHDGYLWLGDNANGRLLRLNPANHQFTGWELPAFAYPQGLAVADEGLVWYADPSSSEIASFTPAANRLERYALPFGTDPEMITTQGSQVWYTEDWQGTLGRLDPAVATPVTETLSPTTSTAAPSCALVRPVLTETVTIATGNLNWASQSYSATVDSGGWQILQIPYESLPWGIVATDQAIYAVENYSQVLIRLESEIEAGNDIYLPLLIK